MNIIADELATEGLKRAGLGNIYKPIFHATQIGLKTTDGKDVEDLRKYLISRMNGAELMNYYRERRGWDRNILHTIDWEAVDGLLRKSTPLQKNKHMQTMHNWQNVGAQKGKIRDSRLKLESDLPLQPTEEEKDIHLCPNGCGVREDNMHYLRCQDSKMKLSRELARKRMLGKIKNARTDASIASIISHVTKKISYNEDILINDRDLKKKEVKQLRRAIEGQDEIGWMAMLQGYIHVSWAYEQDKYFRSMGWNKRKYNKQVWRQSLLRALTEYTRDCWKLRNDAIHGDNTVEGRTIRLNKLRKQVEQLYKNKKEMDGKQARLLYAVPIKQRLKYGVQALTLWIGKVEEVLKMNREQADKYTIRRWLGCR